MKNADHAAATSTAETADPTATATRSTPLSAAVFPAVDDGVLSNPP